jgi:catechol 2,3-dioxygenase-like lactoylglutathione lyase family enzyme
VTDPPPILRVRVAFQTDRLDACAVFYRDLLGLPVLGRFDDHAGYDGVIFGLSGSDAQLELTTHRSGSPASTPAADDLLVLYLGVRAAAEAIVGRCLAAGIEPVAPENPYWDGRALVVQDPDWRLVVLDWGLA